MPKSPKLYFEIMRQDVHFAADLVDTLLGISAAKSTSSFYGGWHARFSNKSYFGEIFTNAHDCGEGYGVEYHRPEFPDYEMMLWLTMLTDEAYWEIEDKLRHPDVNLFITGFERNWPGPFWGVKIGCCAPGQRINPVRDGLI
ncbi:MAG: hypothetical protein ABJL99_19730 [Aliishimia sp.]